jgi:hypothetical protein
MLQDSIYKKAEYNQNNQNNQSRNPRVPNQIKPNQTKSN